VFLKSVALCALLAIPVCASAQQPPTPPPAQPPAAPPVAKAPESSLPGTASKPMSNEQISDALKNSGLTADQLKQRLKTGGYDPSIADPFLVPAAPTSSVPGAPGAPTTAESAALSKALVDLGIAKPTPADEKKDKPQNAKEDEANPANASAPHSAVFGKDIFSHSASTFDPVTSGPVDPSYRVGIGDQLQLVITGQVEFVNQLDIRRDGTVLVPQVGQIPIAGLTLDGARAMLRTRLATAYAGLEDGRTRIDLTLSRVRSNAVWVIGDVENPGAYQVNALATIFHAVARAGGPTSRGSFRAIELRRAGQTIRTVDLYDYLLRGDATADVRTEQGDVIFVPLNHRAVAISGAVRRPAIYELKPGEGFSDLVGFAGGFVASAATDRVQVDRVLPAEQRKPGYDRVKIDIPLHGTMDSLVNFPLKDADVISVFSIGDLRRNVVSISGAVFQPGEFQYEPGLTVDQLVAKAQGLLPSAMPDRVKLRRPIAATGRNETISLNLNDSTARRFVLNEFDEVLVLDGRVAYPSGTAVIGGAVRNPYTGPYTENTKLRDLVDLAGGFAEYALIDRIKVERPVFETGRSEFFSVDFRTDSGKAFAVHRDDRITVLDARTAFPTRTISVSGAVVTGGSTPYVERETLKDAIELAGGLREEAQYVDVARRKFGYMYSDTTSTVFHFALDRLGVEKPGIAQFVLQPDDYITVRAAPGFRSQRFITLQGMFAYPGTYAITENQDRIAALVARAGGKLPGAYDQSFQLTRDGKLVAMDLEKALRGDRTNDVLLQSGDVITIGADPRTVAVTGAVARPSLIVYRPGLSVQEYIELAGGPSDHGDTKHAVVAYPSGFARRVRSRLGIVYSQPEVVSGSVISVPEKPASTGSSDLMGKALAAISTIASLAVTWAAIRR
jgi:polysaccharide biosynthesis/export protein